MKCRLCDDLGVSVSMADGSLIYKCPDDSEQVEGLATLIADRVCVGLGPACLQLHQKVYMAALYAIRKANR